MKTHTPKLPQTLAEALYGETPGNRKNHKEEKTPQIAKFPNLIDICLTDDLKTIFLVSEDDQLVEKREVKIDGVKYIPPPRVSMPWEVAKASNVLLHIDEPDIELFNDIEQEIRRHVELPDEHLYPFLTAWVCHTYLLEHFNYSPIIHLFAVHAKGKTRTGRILNSMARRGEHVESLREANIIRKASRFEAAMFFDVLDIWKKAERLGAEDIMLCRFDRDLSVPRVLNPEKRGFDDTEHFSIFGPTIIATNEAAHHILESRGITICMRQATKNFDTDPRPKDFLSYKERLTAFRYRWLEKDLPQVVKPCANRLGDILKPLFQIAEAMNPQKVHIFNELVKSLEDSKADAMSDTPEGQIVKALIELESEVYQGKLKTEHIVNHMNEGRPERFHVGGVSIGKKLSALGFENTKIGDGRGIFYNKELIGKLASQYGHEYKKSVLTVRSAPIQMNIQPEGGQIDPVSWTDVSRNNNVAPKCPTSTSIVTLNPADRTDMADGTNEGTINNNHTILPHIPEGF